jgi:multicomponent Na+:H+ antiporter subunit D
MAHRLANAPANGVDPAPVLVMGVLLLSVFALKAGLVPFQFWVPGAYRAAPAPVTAMLAGVTKKVGIYAIVRLTFTVLAAGTLPGGLGVGLSGTSFLAFVGPVLFVLAVASILFGGVGAVDRDDVDGVLAYSSISQAGFIVLPLAVAATAPTAAIRHLGVAAALVYALNHSVAKATLFLLSGTVEDRVGSDRFDDLGGLTDHAPVAAGVFLVGGLALVGIPPLVGFFGKLFVFDTAGRTVAAAGTGGDLALAVALAGGGLSIAYVSRAWNRGFWGEATPQVEDATWPSGRLVVVGLLALAVLALGIGVEPVLRAAEAGADAAVSADGRYVDAVLPEVGS